MIVNRSIEFKEAVKLQQVNYPPNKIINNKFNPQPIKQDAWTKQAEQVATNLKSFTTFINSIRRVYLDINHHSTTTTTTTSTTRSSLDLSKGLITAWEGVRSLTDRERDEIDLEVKAGLRRSLDRVRELEAAEKLRIANEARQNPPSSSSSFAARFLNYPTSKSPTFSPLTSHRAHITLYLNTLLSNVSQLQIKQQETRINRQLEKRITLGGSSSSSSSKGGGKLGMQSLALEMAEQARLDKVLQRGGGGGGGKGKGKATSSMIMGEVPSIYRPTPLSYSNEEAEESIDSILTPFQIQQFEAETSALLNSTESDLKALQKAETSLLEISALQSQLAIHLTQQSELTDQLWAESVEVTGKVTEGNVQLKKARERNREGRVWLLIFLVGASLSLLFLDYYT